MGWKHCPKCNRFYPDTNEACPNPACKAHKQALPKVPPPLPQGPHPAVPFLPKVPPPLPKGPHPVPFLPKAGPTLSQKADLIFYRGEKKEWWPSPDKRLVCGMTLREPWPAKSMNDLWERLRSDINAKCFGNIAAYAQYLRSEGKPYALATARTNVGSYDTDYNYVIEIKNARTFYWGADRSLGEPAPFTNVDAVNADYIVLNAETISGSTILGFGHNTKTKEVTFFHDLPIGCVLTCAIHPSKKPIPVSKLNIAIKESLSFQDKIKLGKLLR